MSQSITTQGSGSKPVRSIEKFGTPGPEARKRFVQLAAAALRRIAEREAVEAARVERAA